MIFAYNYSVIMLGGDTMKVVYIILKDGRYQEVLEEEYRAFEGEKFISCPFWRSILVSKMLLSFRYM